MNLIDRAKNIIISPKTEWDVVANEEPNTQEILMSYILPLSLIPTAASILGSLIFFPYSFRLAIATGIGMGLVHLLVSFGVVLLAAFIIDALAPNFGSQKNFGRAIQLVAYSYTPAWIAGILFIIPFLGLFAWIASFYSIYLIYLGLNPTMKTPENNRIGYLIVSFIILTLAYVILWFILLAIIMGIVGAMFGLGALGTYY